MKRINKVGQRFGKLKVIDFAGKNKWGNLRFLCKCDCGNESIVVSASLRSGQTTSCGCYGNERKFTHNMSHSPLYHVYHAMKQRCENPKYESYRLYGARGIKCFWDSFEEFINDMKNTYRPGLSIDRIDNNGPYSKENCRWATQSMQMKNTRKSISYRYKGGNLCLNELAGIRGIKNSTLYYRLRISKWPLEKALFTPGRI